MISTRCCRSLEPGRAKRSPRPPPFKRSRTPASARNVCKSNPKSEAKCRMPSEVTSTPEITSKSCQNFRQKRRRWRVSTLTQCCRKTFLCPGRAKISPRRRLRPKQRAARPRILSQVETQKGGVKCRRKNSSEELVADGPEWRSLERNRVENKTLPTKPKLQHPKMWEVTSAPKVTFILTTDRKLLTKKRSAPTPGVLERGRATIRQGHRHSSRQSRNKGRRGFKT